MSPLVLVLATVLANGEASRSTGFSRATKALEAKNPGEAIQELERLADDGIVDPSASFDRGLAYAMRAAIDPRPGDLGRAIHGFEEAADLSGAPEIEKVARGTSHTLKQEIAKRNSRNGVTVGVEPARTVDRAIARALPENAWAGLTLGLSWLATVAIALTTTKRRSAAVAIALSASLLASMCALCTWFARRERLIYQEGIVIAELAHPEDESRRNLPTEYPLPEGTRLLILDERGSRVKVRLVARDAWVARSAVLPITKAR